MSKSTEKTIENDFADQAAKPLPGLELPGPLFRTNAKELTDSTPPTIGQPISILWRRIMFATWLAVLLGIVIEGILLGVLSGLGQVRSERLVIAGMIQKVSWSTIVCVGLAIGTTASKLRVPLMGIAGLFSAPLAFIVAKSLHQSAAQALSLAAAAAGGPSPVVLALIKGLEYLVLGTILGWVSKRRRVRAIAYMLTGLAVGIVFGSAILAITYHAASQPIHAPQLISMGINELLFPFGCSLVLFTAGVVVKGSTAIPVGQSPTRSGSINGPILRGAKGEKSGKAAATIG
jgi:hypothetical protein